MNSLATKAICALMLLLSGCSTTAQPPEAPDAVPDEPGVEVAATATATQGQDALAVELAFRRRGHAGSVAVDATGLPPGTRSQTATLAAGADRATLTLEGTVQADTRITVRLRFAGRTASYPVQLRVARASQPRDAGRHRQRIENADANLEPRAFDDAHAYANFRGSLCQVMVQGERQGLYVCFNGPVEAGRSYRLGAGRGLSDGTASVTYYQKPKAAPDRAAFWDSAAGELVVESFARDRMELRIRAAEMVPAADFAGNLAEGRFALEAATTITEIANHPGSPQQPQ